MADHFNKICDIMSKFETRRMRIIRPVAWTIIGLWGCLLVALIGSIIRGDPLHYVRTPVAIFILCGLMLVVIDKCMRKHQKRIDRVSFKMFRHHIRSNIEKEFKHPLD